MKIGVCFPQMDFENMNIEDFLSYMVALSHAGVNNYDFFIDFFLEMNHKKIKLVEIMKDNDISISMHYQGLIKDAIKKLKTVESNLDVNYKIPVVFHLPSYDKNKYEHIKEIKGKLEEIVENKKFDILIETLSKNHPNNQNLGDDISEINLFLKLIDKDNFGVCWDTGHTRINSIEENTNIYINDISRVKMTHIHNFYYKNKYLDHIPFTHFYYQDDEIKYLVKNGYKGIYSLEFPLNNLKENIYIYLNSVMRLKKLIEEVKNEF